MGSPLTKLAALVEKDFKLASGAKKDLKTLGARYETAKLIKDLKARVEQLGNRNNLIIQLPERPRAVRIDPPIQALYTDAANLQGIDGPRQELVERLQDGAPQLKVVSIVGFGGIGKTTLANQVYKAIQGQYDHTAFVSISRFPNFTRILLDILQQFRPYKYVSSLDDENKGISLIRELLQDKRYLIVIDDIWTVEAWNIIKCCLIDNNRGSRIITTTRTEDTAKECCSTLYGYVYKIQPLNDADSTRLLYRRIFHAEDACPEQLKCISSEILKKCGGLPLAILTVGSILASHQEACSMEIWDKIINSFGFQLERSPALEWMRHVFDLGYNDLSLNLKTCMLYLGVYPEDCKILKNSLLRRWIAEGFITGGHGDFQAEEIAEFNIHELINRNMVQIDDFDDCGEVFSVRVHDLLLEYILLKSTEQNFITTINDKQSTKGSFEVRRLSLHVRNSENCDVLASMALTQARRYDMPSVSSLFQLRYLRTRGISCKKLMRTQLRNLEQLRTLEVAVSELEYFRLDPEMLPSTLWHLDLKGGVKLDGRIGRLRDLRTLCSLEIVHGNVGGVKELAELTNLRELKLYQCLRGGDDETCDVLLSSLCKLCDLRSLIISGPFELNRYPDFLARWSPPPRYLRRLHVMACLFSTVPADFLAELGNLSSLEINVLSLQSDGADVLARLTLLVHLTLHIETAPREGVVVIRRAAFPNLREFSFRCEAPCLAFEAGAMPRLRVLHIECYEQGTWLSDGVLDGIEHLGSLDELKSIGGGKGKA
ncbi:unnamed protein product [Urochloa decumbens]|uniref:NB-ARC domain-containing protein n=1 Tax=Urochloa decumbens TaxID=240449 RepID=A0ABC9FJN3_9POAL